jgi:hypothetical protein
MHMFTRQSPRLRYAITPVTAIDNVTLFETIASGGQAVTPSPAARSYYQESIGKSFQNPTFRSAWLENAWIPFMQALDTPREFAGYQDKMLNRRSDYGRTVILLDAHDVPGSVQNNPNDPQNELRLSRWRPGYRQASLRQNRDEFIPITVDTLEIARIMQTTSPDSTEASEFVASQMIMAGNKDIVDELHTLFWTIADFASQANVWQLQLPDLRPSATPTEDTGRQFAALIRAQVLSFANFTGAYTPAKNNVNVPADQVRLIIRISTMQQLGALAYATSFNPEFVFALPADQIVEVPDEYFDRNPGLSDQVAFLVDAGTDKKWGSLVLDDTFYGTAVDVFQAKTSENRVLHHSSIIGVNPFKAFVIAGIGTGSQSTYVTFQPTAIVGTVYGPPDVGIIAADGDLVRGQQYSTTALVTDANGYPAGGWIVTETGLDGETSGVQIYGNLFIAPDESSDTVTVTFTSIADPSVTVSYTFNVTGTAFEPDGSGIIVQTEPTLTFAAGSGAGGSLTYSGVPTGVSLYGSLDDGVTYTTLGASPVAVAHGASLLVQERAASGYVFPDGTNVRQHGPYTAA